MIVVFGSRGQLGEALMHQLGSAPEHVFLHRDSLDYCGDISNTAGITESLLELRPRIIINAAAYTAVDQAEDHPDDAHRVNAKAPGVLAQIAAKIDALLIHYSTDYVFDGSGKRPWVESDGCSPLSVYGQSKRAGEEAIMAVGGKYFILRGSWLYSSHGSNFMKTMLRLAETQEEIRVVNDQWGVPTHVDLIVEATLALIDRVTEGLGSTSAQRPEWGIYHCAPAGETTWAEYALHAINIAKQLGRAQVCKKITGIPTAEYPTKARRPLNSRLDTTKLKGAVDFSPPDWREQIVTTVQQICSQQE